MPQTDQKSQHGNVYEYVNPLDDLQGLQEMGQARRRMQHLFGKLKTNDFCTKLISGIFRLRELKKNAETWLRASDTSINNIYKQSWHNRGNVFPVDPQGKLLNMKNPGKRFSASDVFNSFHYQSVPGIGEDFRFIDPDEKWKEIKSQDMRSNVSGSLNNCDKHCYPHGGHRRPVDPRERWRKMSIRGLYDTDDLQKINSRKTAHFKSEINHNWEKNMQNGVSGKPVLRRKERNTASRLFGFGSRGNKLEWTQERKKKSNNCNFQIPSIIITEPPEAPTDI